MHRLAAFAAAAAFLVSAPAIAQDVKVGIGISGWTGFAPLTLANQAGIFKKNGLDVTIKKIPQKDRHLAIASGDVQCAATTVETWVVWNANGVATTQIFQLDKSYGADGMVVRNNIAKIADLKGKTVAASAPGTAPYFTLAWFLRKNGLSVKDVTVVNLEPGPAAQALGLVVLAERLREMGFRGDIDAADFSPEMLEKARGKPSADLEALDVGRTDIGRTEARRGQRRFRADLLGELDVLVLVQEHRTVQAHAARTGRDQRELVHPVRLGDIDAACPGRERPPGQPRRRAVVPQDL